MKRFAGATSRMSLVRYGINSLQAQKVGVVRRVVQRQDEGAGCPWPS